MGQWGYYDDEGDSVQDRVISIERDILPPNLEKCKTYSEKKISKTNTELYTTKDNIRCANNRIEYIVSNLDKVSEWVKENIKYDGREFLIPGIAIFAARGWGTTSHLPKELPKNFPEWLRKEALKYSQKQLNNLCKVNAYEKNIDVVCNKDYSGGWKDWESREKALQKQISLFSNTKIKTKIDNTKTKIDNTKTKTKTKTKIDNTKISVKPLTVDIIRSDYWDKKTKKGKEIHYYSFQSYDGKDLNNKSPMEYEEDFEIFIPDGKLKHEINGKEEIIDDWLSKSNKGPYKKSDSGKGRPDFYYLGGLKIYNNRKEYYWAQVCSGPLNVISEDCLDEVNWWIGEPSRLQRIGEPSRLHPDINSNNTKHILTNKKSNNSLCPHEWENKAKEYALTIEDILDLESGDEVELLLLHRNIWDPTTSPKINKPKYNYTPNYFFRQEKWIYTHIKDLTGLLRRDGEEFDMAKKFEWELNISEYGVFDPVIGYLKWYPLKNGKMKPMSLKSWKVFQKNTMVGWRGSALYWENLKDLPRIFYISDGCLVCHEESNICDE